MLDLIGKGVPSTKILELKERQEIRQRQGQEVNGIGSLSEKNILRAIVTLPMVVSAKQMPHHSISDIEGIDILVRLDTKSSVVPNVKIQAKSSLKRIWEFIQKIEKRNNLKSGEGQEWLLRNRWMVLNGTLLPENIRHDFLFQLDKINEYAKEDSGGARPQSV